MPNVRTLAYQTCKLQDLELKYGESKTLSKVLTPNISRDYIVVSSLGVLPPKRTFGGPFGEEGIVVRECAMFTL